MKKTVQISISLVMALLVALTLAACKQSTVSWDDAIYQADTELGEGNKTIRVEVAVLENSVTFTLHTDKQTVGEALMEHGLIGGDEGVFGLYVKRVNGITADYDVDGSYWAFYVNGDYAMTGVDMTPISEQDAYRLVYTK